MNPVFCFDDQEEDDEDELEDEKCYGSVDVSLSSANPDDIPENELQDLGIEGVELQQSPPLTLRPFQLLNHLNVRIVWHQLFDEVVSCIFAEFNIENEIGKNIWVGKNLPDQKQLLTEICEDGLEVEVDRRHVTYVQREILAMFDWAIRYNQLDIEVLLDEARGRLSDYPLQTGNKNRMNEFTHRSNGHSAQMHVDIVYEGSWDDGALPNDGFTIVAENNIARNYDR